SSDVPKKRARRIAVSAVMPRLPWTISSGPGSFERFELEEVPRVHLRLGRPDVIPFDAQRVDDASIDTSLLQNFTDNGGLMRFRRLYGPGEHLDTADRGRRTQRPFERADAPVLRSRDAQRCDRRDLLTCQVLRTIQLVVALQVDPELRRRPEVPRQPQRGVRSDPSLTVHDLIDPAGWHFDRDGELVLGDPEALDKVLHENLSRVDRGNLVSGSQRSPPPPVRRRSTQSRCATGR